jgi:hypothetical protein
MGEGLLFLFFLMRSRALIFRVGEVMGVTIAWTSWFIWARSFYITRNISWRSQIRRC